VEQNWMGKLMKKGSISILSSTLTL